MAQDDEQRSRVTRRDFIRISSATASTTLAGGWAAAAAAPAAAAPTLPVVSIAKLSTLKPDTPLAFTYPDSASPALLVRLAQPAIGGVGPGQSIVAFSMLCTHKGCPVSYRPDRKLLVCPCHWSSFDPAKAGQMVIGQASESLPQIRLRLQGDEIQAIGIDGLVYGRHTNVL